MRLDLSNTLIQRIMQGGEGGCLYTVFMVMVVVGYLLLFPLRAVWY